MSRPTIRIATRKSALAMWQTEHVAELLRRRFPELEVSLLPLSTRGDEVLDRSLAAIGGKGLFLKELEVAMQRGEADCAVHSLKDVPMDLDAGFVLPAVLERADPFDGFISPRYDSLQALPSGAVVGTSSLRRRAQLLALRPDVSVRDLRGNVNTRLAKLDAGAYDAIILACAGLQRLGFDDRIRARLEVPTWLPAPAQGAIAIEARSDLGERLRFLEALDHRPTRDGVEAERAMNRALHGSCHVPVAAYAEPVTDGWTLRGWVGGSAGRSVRAEHTASADCTPDQLGIEVARKLLDQGAASLLADAAT